MLETARLLLFLSARIPRRNFDSPEIRATLAAWGMHLDFSPDVAGGALFPYLESMANQSFGMVIGAGGADTMIKAMVARLKRSAARCIINAEVAEIRREGGTRGRRAAGERRDGSARSAR